MAIWKVWLLHVQNEAMVLLVGQALHALSSLALPEQLQPLFFLISHSRCPPASKLHFLLHCDAAVPEGMVSA